MSGSQHAQEERYDGSEGRRGVLGMTEDKASQGTVVAEHAALLAERDVLGDAVVPALTIGDVEVK